MRLIRPFWDFYTARRKLVSGQFWKNRAEDLFARVETSPLSKTALVWMPERAAMLEVARDENGDRARMINLLIGLDIVIFNFARLLGRMRHNFGIEDEESFELFTTESPETSGYRLQRRVMIREGNDGEEYRIVTTRFQRPDGEELKIEKDYSESLTDPNVSIRLYNAASKTEPILHVEGVQSQLKSKRNGIVRVITRKK
ncbi:MAG: hypothetical protein ACYTGL_06140 [Planctomycetota bacterium]|jgi:hypothetical protein